MTDVPHDELGELLADGWDIAGYTTCILSAGAQNYNILLRKENALINFSIIRNGDKELVRGKSILTPYSPAEKKGWFG